MIIDEDDVYGDGVNIAARLAALADPGSVVISSAVFEQVRDRVPDSFEDLGDQQVKNIARSPHRTPSKRPTQSLLRLRNLEHAGGNRSRPRLAAGQRRKSKTPDQGLGRADALTCRSGGTGAVSKSVVLLTRDRRFEPRSSANFSSNYCW